MTVVGISWPSRPFCASQLRLAFMENWWQLEFKLNVNHMIHHRYVLWWSRPTVFCFLTLLLPFFKWPPLLLKKECFLLKSSPGPNHLVGVIYPGNNSSATGSLDHIPSIPLAVVGAAHTCVAAVSGREGSLSLHPNSAHILLLPTPASLLFLSQPNTPALGTV